MNDSFDTDHLLELAHGYIEGRLTPAELAELETLLTSDTEARRVYLDFLHDHASLHWDHVGTGTNTAVIEAFPPLRARRFPTLWQAFAAAALVALLALVATRPGPRETTFATMKKTEAAQWESGTLPTAEGARLGAGVVELVRGLATISFDSGAEVVLEAPARLSLVDGMNCVLERGTAVAEVGESATGFTIRTPSARVIDYGTRFAVNVDATNGATQTQVFDGLVEVEEPESKKRIALREGQQALVTGSSLGGISEGVEEGTWSNPETPARPREPGIRSITTADPGGGDTYVWGGKPTTHTSETLLLLKNGLGPDAPHRKTYLRFPLDSIAPGKILSARLDLRLTPTGWGLASHLGDSRFKVYGILDESLDGWEPASLAWDQAPANDPASGNSVRNDLVRELGSFTVPRGIQTGSFGIDGEALRDFLNADGNRRATLLIVRETPETRGGGLVHAFASSRHPTLAPPTLELKVSE